MKCIDISIAREYLAEIVEPVEVDGYDKDPRTKIWDITAEDVSALLRGGSVDSLVDSGKVTSKRVIGKLGILAEKMKGHKEEVSEFVDRLSEMGTYDSNEVALRNKAIALELVMETVKGEVNKAENHNVILDTVANSAGVPHVPAHRLAATIGRKIMYANKIRYMSKTEKTEAGDTIKYAKPADVEMMYYTIGMTALNALEESGFIEIKPKGEALTIKDYLDDIEAKFNYKDPTTADTVAISLNVESLGAVDTKPGSDDVVADEFRGKSDDDSSGVFFNGYLPAIKAANILSTQENITKPATDPDRIKRSTPNAYEPLGTTAQVMDELESHPTHLQGAMHVLFSTLHKELADSPDSASKYIKSVIQDPEMLKALTGIQKNNKVLSDADSYVGRNLAKTTPIDDLVEYFEMLDGPEPQDVFFGLFGGNNSRLYIDNTMMNPHSSKMVRYALAVDEYTLDVDSKGYDFFVDKVADTLKSPEGDHSDMVNALIGDKKSSAYKAISAAIEAYDQMEAGTTALRKLASITRMYAQFPKIEMSLLVTTVKAAKEIRESVKTGELKTTYMVGTDATASGGQLTLMQALGSNPDAIKGVMQQLGLLNSEGAPKKTLDDIYGILKTKLEKYMDGTDLDAVYEEDADAPGSKKSLMKMIYETLYGKDMRDLSKGPTMTFIYDQKRVGAKLSLSKDLASKLIDKVEGAKGGKLSKEIVDILDVIVPEFATDALGTGNTYNIRDPKLKKAIVEGFAGSGVPEFLYDSLTSSLTDTYLKPYKALGSKVFKFITNPEIKGLSKMKILPAGLVLDQEIDGNHLDADVDVHGVTLSKIFEVIHNRGSDDVLTREQKLHEAIITVSQIHSADTANLTRSIAGLAPKYDSGIITVHDEIRGRADLVLEAQDNYVKANYDVGYHYDIYEQVLKSAAVYNPSLTGNPDYTKLLKEVEANKLAKQKILEDVDNGYNFETTSVIGDEYSSGRVSERFSDQQKAEQQQNKKRVGDTTDISKKLDEAQRREKEKRSKKEVKKESTGQGELFYQKSKAAAPTAKTSEDIFSENKHIEALMSHLAKGSDIITDFLASPHRAKVALGNKFSFRASNDTVLIDSSGKFGNTDKIRTAIEHEIVHSATVGVITQYLKGDTKSSEMQYIHKSLLSINRKFKAGKIDMAPEHMKRLSYILGSPNIGVQLAEFIAVMNAEPETAAAIYAAAGNGSNLKAVINALLKKIRRILRSPTAKEIESGIVNPALLYSSMNYVFQEGKTLRETSYELNNRLQNEFFELDLNFEPKKNSSPNIDPVADDWISHINRSIAVSINNQVIDRSGNALVSADNFLKINYPAYRRARQALKGIYKDSEALQSLVHKITNSGVNNAKKNEVLSMHSAIRSDNIEITSNELRRFKKATKGMSEAEMEAFYDFSTKMSMADYFMLADDVTDVDAEIKAIIADSNFSPVEVANLKTIVDMNVNGVVTKNTKYNLKMAGYDKGIKRLPAKKLLALMSVKEIGVDKLEGLKANAEVTQVLKDTVMANSAIVDGTPNLANMAIRDSGIVEEFSEPTIVESFSKAEYAYYENPGKLGWVVLREPTSTTLGIAYRKVIDATYQEGVFTGISLQSSDVSVKPKNKNAEGVVAVGDEFKVLLTDKEKTKLGILKDPSQSLVRSMTHNLAIKESNNIRDMLLQEDTHWDLSNKSQESLEKVIKDPNRETPWLLKDVTDGVYSKLSPTIRAKYMRLPTKLSNVGGFDKKISYVRKDIGYWLVGSSEPSIANNKHLQWATRITKNLVSGTKIGMVVLNPMKIAVDNVSNLAYLTVMGVSPMFIQREYRNILDEFNGYKKLRNELNILRLRSYEGSTKHDNRIAALEDQIKNHPGNGFVERGFINSLGSEIIMNADDPSSGFKTDIDFVLKKIFTEKNGRNNKLADFIMKASRFGINVEELLETWSPLFGQVKAGKELESSLNDMAEQIRHIKTEDDIVDYVHQYINSPNSEFVKLGTHMTDLADVTAKETYYRHLVAQGVSAKAAELEVIDSFPDYKEGLPTKVKQLSDMGILMFPSYWIRIQKAIYRMVKNKPVGFGTEMAIESYFQINSPQIWDQNILNKSNSFFGIAHTPWQHMGVGSILPTHVL